MTAGHRHHPRQHYLTRHSCRTAISVHASYSTAITWRRERANCTRWRIARRHYVGCLVLSCRDERWISQLVEAHQYAHAPFSITVYLLLSISMMMNAPTLSIIVCAGSWRAQGTHCLTISMLATRCSAGHDGAVNARRSSYAFECSRRDGMFVRARLY